VIDKARGYGINLFETAGCYAHGAMEEKLGERLRDDSRAVIVTKIGTDRTSMPRKCFTSTFLREQAERSRDRLKRPAIDILLLHNPVAATVEQGEATGALKDLASEGTIRAWGVAAGSLEVARAALAQGAQVLSLAYNAFCSKEVHALHEDVQRTHCGILARSVLAHGLLAGYWPVNKDFPDGDHRSERWTYDDMRRRSHDLQAIRVLVGGPVYTMRAAALRWVLTNDDLSCAILGPRSSMQLDQLVREAGKGPPYLSEETLQKFSSRIEALGVEV
jgi:aryl-alcohol dehydrogenase-like predicted oxidoreductase